MQHMIQDSPPNSIYGYTLLSHLPPKPPDMDGPPYWISTLLLQEQQFLFYVLSCLYNFTLNMEEEFVRIFLLLNIFRLLSFLTRQSRRLSRISLLMNGMNWLAQSASVYSIFLIAIRWPSLGSMAGNLGLSVLWG